MFNVVVTVRGQHGFGRAVELLRPLGRVERTGYFNVLALDAPDPRAALERLSARARSEPEVAETLAHVTPLTSTFAFRSPEEFDRRAREALEGFVPQLAGRSFYVRFHRRGFKDRIRTQEEEQRLDDFLLGALERRCTPGSIDFEDPDAVVVVESVGTRGGASLWTREELETFPLVPRQ